ncbi:hypothetical protein Tco_0570988 [Tanacetum coccineum]
MTTPHPSVTPHTRVLIMFIILSDSDDEVTTLLVRHAPLSPDYVPASLDYSPDSDSHSKPTKDYLSDEDLTKTFKSPHTQIDLTLIYIAFTSTTPLAAVPPPPLEHIESVGDDIETLRARLTSAELETVTLRARVESLEQYDGVTRDLVTGFSGDRQTRDFRAAQSSRDVEALHARAEAAEQQAEALQALLGPA